jgi:hypothetical protein
MVTDSNPRRADLLQELEMRQERLLSDLEALDARIMELLREYSDFGAEALPKSPRQAAA